MLFRGIFKSLILPALGAAIIAALSIANAADDDKPFGLFSPLFDWQTIESEHFAMHYPKGSEQTADDALQIAEDVHKNLQPLMRYTAAYKVDLVLLDSGDDANGFTQVYPYNRIVLYTAPPDSRSQLNDYQDWLRILIAHEYAHVLHLDNKSGLPAIINYVFGKLVNPNLASPHWLSEGIAVNAESIESDGGRLRSGIFDMYLRADVLGGRFKSIDQVSGTPADYLDAANWYLYGSAFMRYLADRFGDEVFGAIAYLYGRRIIPYGINAVMEEISGYDYPTLYKEWEEFLKDKYVRQKQIILKHPPTEGEKLSERSGNYDFLRLSPDGGTLYYYVNGAAVRPGIYSLNLKTNARKLLLPANEIGGMDLSGDGRELIISLLAPSKNHFYWHDLYSYRIDKDRLERVTQNERAVTPAVSPDARYVAFARHRFAHMQFYLLDRKLNKTTRLFAGEGFDGVFDPAFSPDGSQIIFVGQKLRESRNLYLYDLASGALTKLTDDRSVKLSARFSADGSYVYYSCDAGVVYNVFRIDLASGKRERVTNVIGGAFSPAISADGSTIYFVDYSSDGYDVRKFVYPPYYEPIAASGRDFRGADKFKKAPSGYKTTKPKDYSAFPSVYPHVWIPSSGTDYAGNTLGVRLFGSDATGEHSWDFEVDYGLESSAVSFAGGYSNGSLPVKFSANLAHSSQTLKGGAQKDGKKIDFDESFYNFQLSLSYVFGGNSRWADASNFNHYLSFSYSLSHARGVNSFSYEPDEAKMVLPETGLNSGLSVSWGYGDGQYEPYAVGSAWGKGVSVSASLRHRVLGSQYNSVTFNFTGAYFFRIPYTETHSIAMRLLGGLSSGDYTYRRYFYLGGPSSISLVTDLLYDQREYGIFLRGYPPYSIGGDRFVMLNSEYRFEIWKLNWGALTYPLFFRRLHAAVFFDAGNAWGDAFEFEATKKGVGGELRLDMIIGYMRGFTLSAGYSVGLDAPKEKKFFILLDNVF